MERNKSEKGKEEENRERQRLSSFLLIEPDSLEINLLELITAQIQLTEVPVHFEAAWHLPEAEHRERERERGGCFAISIPDRVSTALYM